MLTTMIWYGTRHEVVMPHIVFEVVHTNSEFDNGIAGYRMVRTTRSFLQFVYIYFILDRTNNKRGDN